MFAADYDELSPRGIEQARALGHFWRSRTPPDAVFTGPARRHRDTARWCAEAACSDGLVWPEPEVVPGLDEHDAFNLVRVAVQRHVDDSELSRLAERAAAPGSTAERSSAFARIFEAVMARWLAGTLDAPGIETWPDFASRVDRATDHVIARATERVGKGARVVVFSSVGPVAVVVRRALNLTPIDAFRSAWRVRNASITSLLFRAGELTLDELNGVPHLPDPATWTLR